MSWWIVLWIVVGIAALFVIVASACTIQMYLALKLALDEREKQFPEDPKEDTVLNI